LGEAKCTPDKILAMPMIDYDSHIDRVVSHSRESLAKTAKTSSNSIGAAEVHNIQDKDTQNYSAPKKQTETAFRRTNVSFRSRPSMFRAQDQFSAKL